MNVYALIKVLHESFEIAEEIEQLEHYAQSLESRKFDSTIRKEMRDQSYQARARARDDLKLRGIAARPTAWRLFRVWIGESW